MGTRPIFYLNKMHKQRRIQAKPIYTSENNIPKQSTISNPIIAQAARLVKAQTTKIIRSINMVAGAGFEPTTFGL
jgi:hypothetical protein